MAKNSSTNGYVLPFQSGVAKMPEGYYSGDKPNGNLRAFVEQHLQERPYDPQTDSYDVPAFDKSIETTKATAIYNMHTYWSKKPHDAIREYIRHYTETGDLVLDPFCGSGGTALAALMEGRKAIAIDRSLAATFITKNYCTPVDPNELRAAFEQFVYSVQDKPRRPLAEWLLDYFYKTDEGTYRLPASEEERKLKAEGRKAGTNRKIKRYVALLEQGLAIPDRIRPNDATLAEWIRACKRSGLYEQGKLLYEKGGLNLEKLLEELMVNVEEDYQVCVRTLARDAGKKGKTKD